MTRESITNFETIRTYLMASISAKTQELGMKMMDLKEQKMEGLDIWNSVQTYSGHSVSILAGNLYILNLCLDKLKEIKDEKTKQVFNNILHIWVLTVLKNDDSINESDHVLIEKTILEFSEGLVPELLGILEAVVAGE